MLFNTPYLYDALGMTKVLMDGYVLLSQYRSQQRARLSSKDSEVCAK